MCSIMYGSSKLELAKFKQGFNKLKDRGPDKSTILESNSGIWGFHRLSIMDLSDDGMQPFKLRKNVLICNGEIYNHNRLKEQFVLDYRFQSGSDCEVLLPLYEQYGLEMFNYLDAEFALIMYDGKNKEVIAARDPLGIRPLFYGYDINQEIMFASEAKALIDLCDKVYPFPIGSYFYQDKFVKYNDVTKVELTNKKMEEVISGINKTLVKGVQKRLVSDAPVGFLLSGGLDSSLVCAIAAANSKKPIATFAIGMSTDAIDLKYAKIVAEHIGSNHTEVIIEKNDVLSSLEEVIYVLETFDITTIRASIGMYLLCRYIKNNTNIKVVLTGEISDELFGYKYTDFAPSSIEFQHESEKRLRELYMYDVLRADRCISSNALEGRVPFGDLDFVEHVLSVDPQIKMNSYGIGKFLLREAFKGDYLPEAILMREKAAFSDAVGHSLVDYLKEYADDFYTTDEFNHLKEKYTHCQPFTKESLLYRELFEKYYPNQAHLIDAFWMPNKEWEGCDVADPSARVLSNYGASGK